MTPLPLTLPATPEEQSHSPPGSQSGAERPERSRNAKAQARHRAKRKAYIEQLEQTVTKLQYALSLSPDQVSVLPPPIVRIRELEDQNKELLRQIEDLRAQLEDRNLRTTAGHRSAAAVLPTFDDRGSDHDTVKRRRAVEDSDDLNMMVQGSIQGSIARQNHSPLNHSPLQLAIPREYHPYSPHTPSQHNHSPATPMVSAPYTLQYQFPEAQASSVNSSPSTASFSASISFPGNGLLHAQPDNAYSPQMHGQQPGAHDHSHAQRMSPSYPAVLHPYARTAQYDHVVKIEEDAYAGMPHGGMAHAQASMGGYSTALPSYGGNNAGMGNWHGYGDGA